MALDLDWQHNNSSRASRFFVHFFAVTVKNNRFRLAKQQLCTCITLFCTFLCRYCMTTAWTECLFSGTVEPDVNTKNDIYFFKLVSSSSWPFCCFYLMYASFRSVTDRNSKILTPTRKGNFFVDLNGPRILRDGREHKRTTMFIFSWSSVHSFRIQLQKKLPTFDELNEIE